MCAQVQRNKLKKPPAPNPRMAVSSPACSATPLSSSQSQGLETARLIRRPMRTESRTMRLARQMSGGDPPSIHVERDDTRLSSFGHGSGRLPRLDSTPSRETSSRDMVVRTAPKPATDTNQLSGNTRPYTSHAGTTHFWNYYAFFQQCLGAPADAVARSVTALEHHWAVRATRAEALLDAHETHKRELLALSETLEERRARELAELNARYAQEFARHRQMVVRLCFHFRVD
ncbi:hypothetical protein BV20DRAFT_80423 [Pilatotrama ljubarskyi]|nr:hypothetical protein BV20DRAFT_80423 [Pilatotrama ljubarskyi]